MRSQEANDTLRIAMDMVMFGVICVILVFLSTISRNMYSIKDEQDTVQEYLEENSRNYFFNYAEHIYGTDIVEFIIKYDEVYDYYITLKNGRNFTITKEYAQTLKEAGLDGDIIWSQEYLTNKVFEDAIFNEYDVNLVENNYTIDFYITEK